MKTCTFIGHKTTPGDIEPLLQSAVEDLILNERVTNFYIGTHGGFDYMAQKVLKECVEKYPQVNFYVVLAYLPKEYDKYKDYSNTIYPHGLEYVPPKYAIVERNKWMIKNSDF